MAPDVIHDIVGSPTGPTIGPEKAHAFYEKTFADFEDGKVTTVKRLYGENFLVDESVWEGTAAGKPFGIEGKGGPSNFACCMCLSLPRMVLFRGRIFGLIYLLSFSNYHNSEQ